MISFEATNENNQYEWVTTTNSMEQRREKKISVVGVGVGVTRDNCKNKFIFIYQNALWFKMG